MRIIKANEINSSIYVAIIVSRFNEEVTHALLAGALQRLNELDIAEDHITILHVPGAVEIPLAAQRLAQTGAYETIIGLGAVIRGETTHYDYVCEQASQGCQHVMLKYDLPVVFGVLTTEDKHQAMERVGGKKGHKGRDAVDTAIEMVSVLRQIA